MTPLEQTGLVAGVYAVARAIEAGFKKITGIHKNKLKEDNRVRQEDKLEDIRKSLNKLCVNLAVMGEQLTDIKRRVEEIEYEFKHKRFKSTDTPENTDS